ncbi:MAG: IS5 family transposase [Polaribacter sp.]|jgi:IS5 family transposase
MPGLLNNAKKQSERLINELYKKADGVKNPRDYHRMARTEFLVFFKKRKKTKK